MNWIEHYDLFLFDFDGLLVNTEEIHFEAYRRMLADYGYDLDWSFAEYCLNAHYGSDRLRASIFESFPQLKKEHPDFEPLYENKKRQLISLLHHGDAHLMPGAQLLLEALHSAKKTCCVVTNSTEEFVTILREKNPILNTIEHWITRDHYTHAKPNPECYLKAIENYANESDVVIGFEDTPRGLRALMQTPAKPVMVTAVDYPELPEFLNGGVKHFRALDAIEGNQL